MVIHDLITRVIPQTGQGRDFANEFEKKLRDQGCFKGRKDSTTSIQISYEYYFDIKEEE